MRAALCLALLTGGTLRVSVTGEPENARVFMAAGTSRGLPAQVQVGPNPFRAAEFQVSAPGYRTLDVRLPWHRYALRRVRAVQVLLVEEHGPAGTWTR